MKLKLSTPRLFRLLSLSALLLVTIVPCFEAVAGPPFPEFLDPNPNPGNQFGAAVVALSTGNVVITSPYDDAGGTDAGAVYVFNGATGALISTLTGSSAGDRIGSGGVTALINGNFVVISQSWGSTVGAATFGNGVTGVSGVVSATNSLVGSTSGDSVGNTVSLNNGNYVVISPNWDNGTVTDAGAVTFGNGTAGITGGVSPANSLVGTTSGDQVGGRSVTVLSNGNYVVCSSSWDSGATADAGAATFGSGTTGVSGPVSVANSLVGNQSGDYVGYDGAVGLSNGNYVVVSTYWHNGALNNAGAVTFGIGSTGVTGPVSAVNSLVGASANDNIGSSGVTGLTNGNYVVCSEMWHSGGSNYVGAATFGNGTTGITGPVTAANSLVGTSANNRVGQRRAIALTNGNYVVSSPGWDNGAIIDVGAATFGSGSVGVSGPVSAANSLVGSTASDAIGSTITALSNGNYVVSSYTWDNGAIANVGAVTWCSGTAGRTGTVSLANSLVGSIANDSVGRGGVTPLSNGNYVVSSYLWDNGAVANAGAVTWGNGTAGTTGSVSAVNSLVGSKTSDWIGSGGVTALTNGNYVVTSPQWDNGGAIDAGAVTFGNGTNGLSGAVSAANSLVGSTSGDAIGDNSGQGVTVLGNGNYVVMSQYWNNGALTDAGAFTFGSGTTGVSGVINTSNSVIGQASSGIPFYATAVMVDNVNQTFFARFLSEGSGKVRLGSQIDGFAVYPEISVFTGNSTAAVDERTDNVGTQSLGSINVGNSSVAQIFTIKNIGAADLTGIAVTTTNGTEFSVNTTGTSAALAANASTTFTVTFSPSSTGMRTGVINIASNDANENPFRINVSGTGLPSTNADLSSLAISTGTLTPVFTSGTMSYSATVPNTTANLTVTPTAAQANATITVNGNSVVSGAASSSIGLTLGANTITTIVTAQDGVTTQTYTITVTRIAAPPGNLEALDLGIVGTIVRATVTQPDGKLIIVGVFSSVLGQPRNNIARLNADGSLDTGFNPNANGDVYCAAILPDGKILLGGYFTALQPNGAVAPTARSYIARINADGTLDPGFDPKANGAVFCMALQPNGRTVLGGEFTTLQPNGAASPTLRQRIARVNGDGSLDTGFDPKANSEVDCVVLNTDGKILIGGAFVTLQPNGAASTTTRSHIARLNADGTLDMAFDPKANNSVDSMMVTTGGRIVVGGYFTALQPNGATIPTVRLYIARLNQDGTLDAGFDPKANAAVSSVVVQADGKTLLGGYFTMLQPNGAASPTSRLHIARLLADGSLDTAFDPSANLDVFCLAVQDDGRVLLGGRFTTHQPNGAASAANRNEFARLENDIATQLLSVASSNRVEWLRGGASPEALAVNFELSTDGGAIYVPLGAASRISGGWELIGLSLPASGKIRARAQISGGYFNGSSGLIEQVANFSLAVAPTVTAISPASGIPAGGTNVTITGTGFAPGATVTIGGTAATGVIVVNTTTITCTTPAGAPGPASVLVTTAGGTNLANSLYTFALPLSSNASLSALTTSAGALTPAFASGTFSYTAPSVWNTPASISVTPTVADATATLQMRVNGGGFVPALSGSASIVALNEGSNAIDVKVTAQDAVTIRTYTLTVTRHAPGQGPPVTVMTSAVNPPPGVPGANWDSIRSGLVLASSGAIAFRGHLDISGSVTADNFQGIWKSPDGTGPSTALVARSGITLAPGTGGALYDILPVNPIINDAAQTTFLSFLRANTGSPLVNTSTDSGVWSELGGTGLKLLLREGDMIGSDTVSTVAPSGTVAGSNTSAAFTVKLATGSALVRVDVAGASVLPIILAKEGGTAPAIGGGTFGPFDSFAGNASDPRMDAVGDLAFLSLIQTGGGGIWYEPTGPAGTLTAVATTGEATPGGIADTFAAFERPTLANSTLIAFRAFLTTSGQSVFKGNPSSPASLVPVAVSRDTTAQIPTIPAGSKLWSIWSPFSNSLGHLAFRVSLLDAVSAETRAVVTDTGGSLAVIAKVGDIAPGAGAETFGNFSHPIIGDGDQAAFLASTDAGTLGLWRQSSGGGALALVMRIGDTVDVGGSTETIAEIIVPGTGSDDRKFETKTMDAAGHILVYVVYNSGKTGVLLTPP